MADVKTADKTVKHISQDATDMPEAMKGVQAPCSARLLRGMFAGLFTGLFAGLFTVCTPEPAVKNKKQTSKSPKLPVRPCDYQRPSMYCIPRLTPAIARQQQKPRKMGLPPDFTSFTRSVLRPIATIAMVMKNFESVFMGANALCRYATTKRDGGDERSKQEVEDEQRKRAFQAEAFVVEFVHFAFQLGGAILMSSCQLGTLLLMCLLHLVRTPERQHEGDRDDGERSRELHDGRLIERVRAWVHAIPGRPPQR